MRSRKGKKRDMLKGVRPIGINMSFSEEEAEIIHDAADIDKSSLQYWARTRLLAAAKAERNDPHYSQFWRDCVKRVEAEDNENQDPVPTSDA